MIKFSRVQKTDRASEKGNVLFLILIAVVLFGALSYAVTQSSQSGSGNASQERALVDSAQITQYPASVRTAIVRMVVGGRLVEDLLFDRPKDFEDLEDEPGNRIKDAVFHPQGGGATSTKAPANVMEDEEPGDWFFSSEYQVEFIGTTDVGGSNTANDIIAFLPGVTKTLCISMNNRLGIVADTDADGDGIPGGPIAVPDEDMSVADTNEGIAEVADVNHHITDDFDAQPFGCYDSQDSTPNGENQNVYYHVLIER